MNTICSSIYDQKIFPEELTRNESPISPKKESPISLKIDFPISPRKDFPILSMRESSISPKKESPISPKKESPISLKRESKNDEVESCNSPFWSQFFEETNPILETSPSKTSYSVQGTNSAISLDLFSSIMTSPNPFPSSKGVSHSVGSSSHHALQDYFPPLPFLPSSHQNVNLEENDIFPRKTNFIASDLDHILDSNF